MIRITNSKKMLTSLYKETVIRKLILDNELVIKKFIEYELDQKANLRLKQILENFLLVSAGNRGCSLAKCDRQKYREKTILQKGNAGSNHLPLWKIGCNDKNGSGKLQKFFKSSKTLSPTPSSGAIKIPPIGTVFYVETYQNNSGNESVFVSFEGIDIIQVSTTSFYYNRYSARIGITPPCMGRYCIQHLLSEKTWSRRYKIPKKGQHCKSLTKKFLISL